MGEVGEVQKRTSVALVTSAILERNGRHCHDILDLRVLDALNIAVRHVLHFWNEVLAQRREYPKVVCWQTNADQIQDPKLGTVWLMKYGFQQSGAVARYEAWQKLKPNLCMLLREVYTESCGPYMTNYI